MKTSRSMRLVNYLKYKVERFLIRGPLYQFIFIALLIASLSLISGFILTEIDHSKSNVLHNSWWAFLRLSDTGYLGDDEGYAKRVLATILTVMGAALFIGAFVAIMTQWLNRTMRQLSEGLTPISMKGHIAILGYTNRTPSIAYEIFSSGRRLKKFLRSVDRSQPHLVILDEDIDYERTQDFRIHMKSHWNRHLVTFRGGNPVRQDELERVDPVHAAAIIIPAATFAGDRREIIDTRTIKTLLSIKNCLADEDLEGPRVVVEILDAMKVALAETAYGDNVYVVSSETMICRLLAQNIVHPGLSDIYAELLRNSSGNGLFIKALPELIGARWEKISHSIDSGIPIGILKQSKPASCTLGPDPDYILTDEDAIVFIATSYDEIEASLSTPLTKGHNIQPEQSVVAEHPVKKILIMGWSYKIPRLLAEISAHSKGRAVIDIISVLPIEERERAFERSGVKFDNLDVNLIFGDFTLAHDLDKIDIASYSNFLILASDVFDNSDDADAKSVLGYLLLREKIKGRAKIPPILVELLDPENEQLFNRKWGEVIISPLIVSYMLANVALKPELMLVFDELFDSGGAEIKLLSVERLELVGDFTFDFASDRVRALGMTAIGIKQGKNSVLNPPGLELIHFAPDDTIIAVS
jgi:hypothetical protein